jgi:hypothetical protein
MPDTDISPGTPYDDTGLLRPPAEAVGLSALRVLRDGSPRQYSAVKFARGWDGVDRFICILRATGQIRASSTATDGYAILDVLDADGDIIADYDIPTARAFKYVKRELRLTVLDIDAEVALIQAGATTTP